MLQELFRIPILNMPIYSYGLMLVVGFLLATQLAKFLAIRSAIDPEVFATAALLALLSGIVGARLSHVIENWGDFTKGTFSQGFMAAINIRAGGLTYYGGFLLATPVAIAYGLYKKVPILRGMDIVAPCLMIGLGFGRIGCFMNGCCYGAETNVPWAVSFPYGSAAYTEQFEKGSLKQPVPYALLVPTRDGREKLLEPALVDTDPSLKTAANAVGANPVHPAELYSTITALLLAMMLTAYYTLPHSPGRVFAAMLILEGATRFLLEMLRVEPPVIGEMSLGMVEGLLLFGSGLAMWLMTGGAPDDLSFHPLTDEPDFSGDLLPATA